MRSIISTLRSTIVSLLLLTLIFGFGYPWLATKLCQNMFYQQANGSLIIGKDKSILGSEFIGQSFSKPQYFWGRPSATAPYPYNATASSGSNLGTNNKVLIDAVKARIDSLKQADPTNHKPIPIDLVTASGSGLDPHISLSAAEYQIPRIAKLRGIQEEKLQNLVKEFTSSRQLGILGEPRVNVLKLNLALDGKI